MRTHHKRRWILPRRLRNEGWWLAEPQRGRPATVLPFIPGSRHAATPAMARKARP